LIERKNDFKNWRIRKMNKKENLKNEKYVLTVFNTLTSDYEEVEVSVEVYDTYRRTDWNIDKNNKKHSYSTICFSDIKCPEGMNFSELKEFASDKYNPEEISVRESETIETAREVLKNCLSKSQIRRFMMHHYWDLSFEEIAKLEGVSRVAIFLCLSNAEKIIKKYVNIS